MTGQNFTNNIRAKAGNCIRLGLAAGVVLALSGCFGTKKLGDGIVTTRTDAQDRLVWSAEVGSVQYGRMFPKQVICAEPSPDTAEAIDRSFKLLVEATQKLSGISGGVGLGYGSTASIIQMTHRMATIQLLRDGLYRACEAYANGAIGKVEYSILLSRFDDTMITMLMAELIAGNFGGELGAISGGEGPALDALVLQAEQSELDVANVEQALGQTQVEVEKTLRKLTAFKQHRKDYKGERAARLEDAIWKLEQDLIDKTAALDGLRVSLPELEEIAAVRRERANAHAQGARGSVGGAMTSADRVKIAEKLAKMQRKYIENINADALLVGCLSLMNDPQTPAEVRDHCMRLTEGIVKMNGAFLSKVYDRHIAEADAELHSVQRAVTVLGRAGKNIRDIECVDRGGNPLFDRDTGDLIGCN